MISTGISKGNENFNYKVKDLSSRMFREFKVCINREQATDSFDSKF